MIEVIPVDRKSPALTPSSLACLSRLPTLNLTAGCAHGCLYCYTRGYSSYPGEGKIKLYQNTLAQLQRELPRKRRRPQAVYFSPSSDPFQPVAQVLDLTFSIFEYLFQNGIGVAFLTKGRIPRSHWELLQSQAHLVRGQIGLITLDSRLTQIFEPRAAPPELRLEQARRLVQAGIETQVRLDPILPGLTDDPDTLHRLCAGLEEAGVKKIAVSVLFLRPAIVGSLKRNLQNRAVLEPLLGQMASSSRLSIHAENSSVLALSASERRQVYARVEEIARRHGIVTKICSCKNPDLATGSCSIAGNWANSSPPPSHPATLTP